MACFWTDQVNATQVCESTPPPAGAVMQFYSENGDGSAYGRLSFPIDERALDEIGNFMRQGVCLASLALIANASTVVVTGYIPFIDGPGNWPDEVPCGDAFPEDGYTAVSLSMFRENFEGLENWSYYFGGNEEEPTNGWYYIRLLVDDTTEVYGLLRRGGGV